MQQAMCTQGNQAVPHNTQEWSSHSFPHGQHIPPQALFCSLSTIETSSVNNGLAFMNLTYVIHAEIAHNDPDIFYYAITTNICDSMQRHK